MGRFEKLLQSGDLRSVGRVGEVIQQVKTQEDFNELFKELFHADRKVVMRAADAVEKISRQQPALLIPNKKEILNRCFSAEHVELKWHLASLVSRLPLSASVAKKVWTQLTIWATDVTESRIVRVNALQALHDLLPKHQSGEAELNRLINKLLREHIPSINARIRKIRKDKSEKHK